VNAAKVARKIFLLVSVVLGKKDYRVRDRGCEGGVIERGVRDGGYGRCAYFEKMIYVIDGGNG